MTDSSYRLARLFNADSGRLLDIAIDHGFFGERSFLGGIEDMPKAVSLLADAKPDAIQLTSGLAPLLQRSGGRGRPALALRTDVANVYGTPLPDHMFSLTLPEPGLAGVRLDAACVVVNLLDLPDRPRVLEACVRNVLAARADCDKYGMPLMVEPLVMRESPTGAYGVNGNIDKILPLVRQAVELGADIIKADPTDDPNEYHHVVKIAAGVPVLVRGGGRVPDLELFERTAAVLAQGARGIVYGRNIIQHESPVGMTRALMAMLHEGATPQRALEILGAA